MGDFSMASMTDIIFLLLIFFMVLSTLIVPNAIRVNLPSSKSVPPSETPMARITLTEKGECFIAIGRSNPQQVTLEELPSALQALPAAAEAGTPRYAALYADEKVPYGEIVKILNITNECGIQLLLATKVLKESGAAHTS